MTTLWPTLQPGILTILNRSAAVQDVETLICLVGVPYNHFELYPEVILTTLNGAIAEGVKRFVLIGTVYPYGSPTPAKVRETHQRNPSTLKACEKLKRMS